MIGLFFVSFKDCFSSKCSCFFRCLANRRRSVLERGVREDASLVSVLVIIVSSIVAIKSALNSELEFAAFQFFTVSLIVLWLGLFLSPRAKRS